MKSAWLENLDLSENELKVMNALLDIQMYHNVTFIAKKANLPRTTTLYILKKFEKRKLAKQINGITGGKRKYWLKAKLAILK